MTLRLVRPAPLLPLVEMLAGDDMPAGLTPQLVARAQSAMGRTFGYVDDAGACVACIGLIETGPGELEAWFACLPGLANHLLAFVRLAQLTLEHARHDATVTTRVSPGWKPGEKLARLTGFRPGDAPGLWTWSGA
jgi:hypothetical protein